MKETALINWHEERAEMGSFAKWKLPIEFSGVKKEHLSVRNSVGIFDISHMGRILIKGSDAERFLNHIFTRNIVKAPDGSCGYGLICNEIGGVKDDVIIYKVSEIEYYLVCNAVNLNKIKNWLRELKKFAKNIIPKKSLEIEIIDKTQETIFFAVQGPDSELVLQKLSNSPLPENRYTFKKMKVLVQVSIISRTGYTGEDGFEIIPLSIKNQPSQRAIDFWESILGAGEEYGIEPCGLGARDSLRIEAGLCLYGHELSEDITPLKASLEFAIDFDEDRDFVGREYLDFLESRGVEKERVGFELREPGVPRAGMTVLSDGVEIGEVSSGTFSPVSEKGIGMAFLPAGSYEKGDCITIRIRDRDKPAEIVELPFSF